jgi:hypothetical protein
MEPMGLELRSPRRQKNLVQRQKQKNLVQRQNMTDVADIAGLARELMQVLVLAAVQEQVPGPEQEQQQQQQRTEQLAHEQVLAMQQKGTPQPARRWDQGPVQKHMAGQEQIAGLTHEQARKTWPRLKMQLTTLQIFLIFPPSLLATHMGQTDEVGLE